MVFFATLGYEYIIVHYSIKSTLMLHLLLKAGQGADGMLFVMMGVFLLMVIGGLKLSRYIFKRIRQEGDRERPSQTSDLP
jgi:hypothetical protein